MIKIIPDLLALIQPQVQHLHGLLHNKYNNNYNYQVLAVAVLVVAIHRINTHNRLVIHYKLKLFCFGQLDFMNIAYMNLTLISLFI